MANKEVDKLVFRCVVTSPMTEVAESQDKCWLQNPTALVLPCSFFRYFQLEVTSLVPVDLRFPIGQT